MQKIPESMCLKPLVRRAFMGRVACAPRVVANPDPSPPPAVEYPVAFADVAELLAANPPVLLHAVERVRSP